MPPMFVPPLALFVGPGCRSALGSLTVRADILGENHRVCYPELMPHLHACVGGVQHLLCPWMVDCCLSFLSLQSVTFDTHSWRSIVSTMTLQNMSAVLTSALSHCRILENRAVLKFFAEDRVLNILVGFTPGSLCWRTCASTTMVSLKFLLQDPLQAVATVATTTLP